MKLIITKNKYKFMFYLPLSLIKSKLLFKLVISNIDSKDININRDLLIQLYRSIKTYKKSNGHFKFLEAKHDNYQIVIKI